MGRSKRKAGSDDHDAQSKMTKQKYATHYQAAWMTDPEFTNLIRSVAEDRMKAFCGHHLMSNFPKVSCSRRGPRPLPGPCYAPPGYLPEMKLFKVGNTEYMSTVTATFRPTAYQSGMYIRSNQVVVPPLF